MRKLHQTIKKVGDDIPALSYNTAIAAMMEYMNVVRARRAHARIATRSSRSCSSSSPFAPHIAEELWERLGARRRACSTRAGRRTTRRSRPRSS